MKSRKPVARVTKEGASRHLDDLPSLKVFGSPGSTLHVNPLGLFRWPEGPFGKVFGLILKTIEEYIMNAG